MLSMWSETAPAGWLIQSVETQLPEREVGGVLWFLPACREDLDDSVIIEIAVLYVRCNITGITNLNFALCLQATV